MKELSPQAQGLMQDPAGTVFKDAPSFVQALARFLIPDTLNTFPLGLASNPFTKKAVQVANATSRSLGAIGKKAVVPRIVEKIATPGMNILDFGAGKSATHASNLRKSGLNVTPYEFGSNVVPGVHDTGALQRLYDIVYASNVANVQSSPRMLLHTLKQIYRTTKSGGKSIINLPAEPRKFEGLNAELLESMLRKVGFSNVERIAGSKSAPIFSAVK